MDQGVGCISGPGAGSEPRSASEPRPSQHRGPVAPRAAAGVGRVSTPACPGPTPSDLLVLLLVAGGETQTRLTTRSAQVASSVTLRRALVPTGDVGLAQVLRDPRRVKHAWMDGDVARHAAAMARRRAQRVMRRARAPPPTVAEARSRARERDAQRRGRAARDTLRARDARRWPGRERSAAHNSYDIRSDDSNSDHSNNTRNNSNDNDNDDNSNHTININNSDRPPACVPVTRLATGSLRRGRSSEKVMPGACLQGLALREAACKWGVARSTGLKSTWSRAQRSSVSRHRCGYYPSLSYIYNNISL